MCGKFTQMASWREVHEFSNLFAARVDVEVRTFTTMRAVPVVHMDSNGHLDFCSFSAPQLGATGLKLSGDL